MKGSRTKGCLPAVNADIIYTLLLLRLVFEAPVGITPALQINARMHLNIAKVRTVGLKPYISQHLNSRAPSLCVLSFLFPFFPFYSAERRQ